ncbi:hypothetical protein EDC96DRAFT_547081 [Choanephora cucurbitarum]|nr:hypothetical protein EDC96DRAFT_547081 [Choanephora cucurbitarum]
MIQYAIQSKACLIHSEAKKLRSCIMPSAVYTTYNIGDTFEHIDLGQLETSQPSVFMLARVNANNSIIFSATKKIFVERIKVFGLVVSIFESLLNLFVYRITKLLLVLYCKPCYNTLTIHLSERYKT